MSHCSNTTENRSTRLTFSSAMDSCYYSCQRVPLAIHVALRKIAAASGHLFSPQSAKHRNKRAGRGLKRQEEKPGRPRGSFPLEDLFLLCPPTAQRLNPRRLTVLTKAPDFLSPPVLDSACLAEGGAHLQALHEEAGRMGHTLCTL